MLTADPRWQESAYQMHEKEVVEKAKANRAYPRRQLRPGGRAHVQATG